MFPVEFSKQSLLQSQLFKKKNLSIPWYFRVIEESPMPSRNLLPKILLEFMILFFFLLLLEIEVVSVLQLFSGIICLSLKP